MKINYAIPMKPYNIWIFLVCFLFVSVISLHAQNLNSPNRIPEPGYFMYGRIISGSGEEPLNPNDINLIYSISNSGQPQVSYPFKADQILKINGRIYYTVNIPFFSSIGGSNQTGDGSYGFKLSQNPINYTRKLSPSGGRPLRIINTSTENKDNFEVSVLKRGGYERVDIAIGEEQDYNAQYEQWAKQLGITGGLFGDHDNDGESNWDEFLDSDKTDSLNLEFVEGWNLFSINLDLGGTKLKEVFGDKIEFVDAITNGNKLFTRTAPDFLNSLHELRLGEGYWLRANNNFSIEFSGPFVLGYNLSLDGNKWHLIGYPARQAISIVEAIAGNEKSITKIIQGSKVHVVGDGFLNTLHRFEPGLGYYIFSKETIDLKFGDPGQVSQTTIQAQFTSIEEDVVSYPVNPAIITGSLSNSPYDVNNDCRVGIVVNGELRGLGKLVENNGKMHFSSTMQNSGNEEVYSLIVEGKEYYHICNENFSASSGELIEVQDIELLPLGNKAPNIDFRPLKNNKMSLVWSGNSAVSYTLQRSFDVSGGDWEDLSHFNGDIANPSTREFHFSDNLDGLSDHIFYRIIAKPYNSGKQSTGDFNIKQ